MNASRVRGLARWGGLALDLLLPPRCLGCGGEVERQGGLCAACWSGLRFITEPCCTVCGRPFDYDMVGERRCATCLLHPPVFTRARSALIYDDASRPLILGFKHGDHTQNAPLFGRFLARAGADVLNQADVVAPIPLHRWRLFRRRYNQSALLALAVSRESGVPAVCDLLQRTKPTPSQGGLDREARRRNVAGVFRLRSGRSVLGKRVVLIDDVVTTGATIGECARVLLANGAHAVDALTLAMRIRE